ncbi:MAG TPA: argininosuccinate lyase [Kiritimatiellia bacterium]|nr:argininosuccinate lyase [Kiritimatiellia bacterium]
MKTSASKRKTTVGDIDAEVLDFTAGQDIELDMELVGADCLGSAAHVTMLSKMPVKPPIFTQAERRQVVRALNDIMTSWRKCEFQITLDDQDVHMAVERVLTDKLGDLGKKVHTGRSRNDQVAVDLRLYAKEQILGGLAETAALADALLVFARKHMAEPMVGRTHMQPAMPSSVGLWASAFAESLLDDMGMLMAAYDMNDRSPLGSAASYGVPLPLDRQFVSDLLGFSAPVHNVLHANNARGKVESIVLFAFGQAMLTLSRLAQDLIIFSMPEFGYFELPAEFCTGSSIMPQKRNPDVLELIRAKASKVLSGVSCVMELIRAAPSGYNRDLQEAKGPFIKGLRMTRSSLRIMTRLIKGVKISRSALLKGFSSGVFATDHALQLVAKGIPFRDAYHQTKQHLDALEKQNPFEAIARKTHLGATAGLDFKGMMARVKEVEGFVRDEEAALQKVARNLLRG